MNGDNMALMPALDVANLPMNVLKDLAFSLQGELMKRTVADVEEFKAKTADTINSQQNEIEKLKNNLNAQSEKVFFIHARSADEKYLTMRMLGNRNLPPIANKMTRLLQYAGILQIGKSIPYSNALAGKEPIAITYKISNAQGYEGLGYKFHEARSWEIIHKKLKKDELFNGFMNCSTKEELDKYIGKLPIIYR